MLNLTDITLRRGPRVLFSGASFTVHAGWKLGVTGANGCGKSSLFAMFRGELAPDAGELALPPKAVIAHVAQETPALERTALDYVIDGDRELRTIEAELAQAEVAGDGRRSAELHGRLEAVDGYTAQARAARLLDGLGFTPEQLQRPVAHFSGGWRMRLNLAQALMCRSDLLLLDEPTNHLDLDAVFWLEGWLRSYPGTLLLISHDREFLDRVVDHVLHIEREKLQLYTGNYSDFEVQRAAALAGQQAAFERQQREIASMQRFVDRFRAKATKARQAQSRLKALERMERIAPAHADSPFHFAFKPPGHLPSPLLALDDVSVGYGGQPVLRQLKLSLLPGDRVGLLGANGAGKSTLTKLLAEGLEPLAGRLMLSPNLRIGYFAQHQLEQLDPAASPLLHLARLDGTAPEQLLRDFLGGFGFQGEAALGPVAPLSGGEKARLVLALLVYQRPNLLLLDEPTNHLDLEMRHALTLALQGFEGALVLVSHDRHLLQSTTDRLLLVDGGAVTEFDGDLEDYRRWLEQRRQPEREAASKENEGAHTAASRRDRRREEAERRQRLQPLRRELEKLEKQVERLATLQAELQTTLADPTLYEPAGKARLTELLKEKGRLDQATAEVEERWLTAGEALEEAERAS